ncbi:hypothetical protein RvY_16148 [Ramazzottius varieornatus]|uniref:Uncharacterized protein n=1 Tax=Ramazzottius varieornatus TaxID=947166 RepID=A0A1D1VYT6_RAMVA|nr:hypothetical protein RvY_16148 [Ramazzottius varieornatus]
MRTMTIGLSLAYGVILAVIVSVDAASVERAKRQNQAYSGTAPNGYQDPAADGLLSVGLVRSAIDWMKTLLRGMGWKPSWDPNVWRDNAGRLINTMWYGETVEEAHARQSGHFFITTPSPYGSAANPGPQGYGAGNSGPRTVTGHQGPGVSVYVNSNAGLPPVPRHPAQKPTRWNETITDIFEVVDKELRQEAV